MKKLTGLLVLLLVAAMLFAGCGAPAANTAPSTDANAGTAASADTGTAASAASGEKETYVWACQYNSLPLFVNNDYIGMDIVAEELGVEVKKIGPQEIDLPAFVAAIEQEIPKKPDGMMVVGWDASLATAINQAIDAGIPVVTVDADVPDSKRLCFVGTDWYQLGVEQAKAAGPFLKDLTGTVVCIGIPGADNSASALDGYTTTMAKLAPNITVYDKVYDSQVNAQVVAETIGNLIKSDETIVGVAGFDAATGPGIAQAIKEAGKVGKVFGTCVDAEAEHLQGVKDGALVGAVGQRRQFFTYYGVKMLYDYNHSKIQFTKDDKSAGITNIPSMVSTGFIVATPDNVDLMIESLAEKTK
jgi:ABC-type sugar transport system substrate-binding protein